MTTSKSIATILTVFVCATALTVDAAAQGRGGGGRGGSSGGGRAPSAGHPGPQGGAPQMGVPRGNPGGAPYHGNGPYPGYGHYPYYGYGRYPYYGYGRYPYYGYPGFSFGFGFGYPYYGYYGYPYYYGAYGYPYPYAAPYPGYGYVAPGGVAYGGIRIQGAPRNAEVYLDGNYVGVVDDYDGTFQRLEIEPGSHEVEVRGGPAPLKYDVNVTPGQTVTLHANVK
jgi:PEGA domain-containing protein